MHIAFELPWSAEQACSSSGARTARTRERARVQADDADVAGEQASPPPSQRLTQLGAITKGDRRGCSGAKDGSTSPASRSCSGSGGTRASTSSTTSSARSAAGVAPCAVQGDQARSGRRLRRLRVAGASRPQRRRLEGRQRRVVEVAKFLNRLLGVSPRCRSRCSRSTSSASRRCAATPARRAMRSTTSARSNSRTT